jgi:hypothetical protein
MGEGLEKRQLPAGHWRFTIATSFLSPTHLGGEGRVRGVHAANDNVNGRLEASDLK